MISCSYFQLGEAEGEFGVSCPCPSPLARFKRQRIATSAEPFFRRRLHRRLSFHPSSLRPKKIH